MPKVSKKIVKDITTAEAENASALYVQHSTLLAKLQAEMNAKINSIKSEYADEIMDLQDAMEEPAEVLEAYAREQQKNWGKRKSHELLHAVIGFRTGTPKVCKDRKITWEGVLDLVRKNKTLSNMFVRTTPELDKQAIIANQNETIAAQLREDCFVYVDQDEKFFIDPKVDKITA